MVNYQEYFDRDPRVCAGQAVFKGTRVTLRAVLASMADGDSVETILQAYPALNADHVRAAIAYAAAAAAEDLPPQSQAPSFG